MTEAYRAPESLEIQGVNTSIQFDPYARLLEYASVRDSTVLNRYISISDANQLPYPTEEVSLYSRWRHEEDYLPHISGYAAFSAEEVRDIPHIWPFVFMDEVKSRLGELYSCVVQLRHDPTALYVAVDQDHFFRLEFYSGPDDCGVHIESVHANDFYEEVSVTKAEVDINPAGAVLKAGKILSIVLDELNNAYDEHDDEPAHRKPLEIDARIGQFYDQSTDDEFETDTDSSEDPVDSSSADDKPAPSQEAHEESDEQKPAIVSTVDLGSRALEVYRYPVTGPSEAELEHNTMLTLDNIGGYFGPRRQLRDIADTFVHPESSSHFMPPNFLVFGPSRADNLQLIEAFANTIHGEITTIRSTDVVDKMIGEGAKRLEDIFKKARNNTALQVLCFDGFDLFARSDSARSSVYDEIEDVLQRNLEDIYFQFPNIIIAGATTKDAESLSSTITQSEGFEKIYAGAPNEQERVDIWITQLGQVRAEHAGEWIEGQYQDNAHNPVAEFDNYDYAALAKLSDGMSTNAIRTVVRIALKTAVARAQATEEPAHVTQELLEQQLNRRGRR